MGSNNDIISETETITQWIDHSKRDRETMGSTEQEKEESQALISSCQIVCHDCHRHSSCFQVYPV